MAVLPNPISMRTLKEVNAQDWTLSAAIALRPRGLIVRCAMSATESSTDFAKERTRPLNRRDAS